MANDCGLICNVSKTRVTYDIISGEASLWDEGTVVDIQIDETEDDPHTNHTGTKVMRSGNNLAWADVTLTLFPCCDWSKELWNAWDNEKLLCGDLLIDKPCCDPRTLYKANVKQMDDPNVSHDSEPLEITFRGLISIGEGN